MAFGFHVINIDGHNFEEIENALAEAKTVKGKGVSFMENLAKWHGSAPNREQAEQAIKELTGGSL